MSGDIDNLLKILTEAGIDKEDARFEMRTFIEHASGKDELEAFARRRAGGEPAAYIVGEKDFYKDTFYVEEGVLIPRSDTEILVETALRFLGICAMPLGDIAAVPVRPDGIKAAGRASAKINIADLCTGSGCIGISVAKELCLNGREVSCILSDISDKALFTASRNAERIIGDAACIKVIREDVLDRSSAIDKEGPFDIITANPPYIDSADMKELPRDVDLYEPHLALFGGDDGLEFYRVMASKYLPLLKSGGAFITEHGYNQGNAVSKIFEQAGFTDIMTVRDYGGNPRVTLGIRRITDAG